mgnify:CR=1 FL=1
MFRYGSFQRPLWIGFHPGVQYKLVEIKKSDEINGRRPHDVIITEERISPESIYNLQLTDYEEIDKKRKLIEYAETKFTGRYLNTMQHLIQEGTVTTKEKINFYHKKLNKEK